MEHQVGNLDISADAVKIQPSLVDTFLETLIVNRGVPISSIPPHQFMRLLIEYGFLDEQGCPVCGIVDFEFQAIRWPFVKKQLVIIKRRLLMDGIKLCSTHLKKRDELHGQYNLWTPTMPVVSRANQHSTGTLPRSSRVARMGPNNKPNLEHAQNKFRPDQQASIVPSKSAIASIPNNDMYSTKMMEMVSNLCSEDMSPYSEFGATAIASSPKFPQPTSTPLQFIPLPTPSSRIWGNKNSATPWGSDEMSYFKFRQSTNSTTKVTVDGDTENFRKETADRRGKKILGQGIYKK